MLKVYDVAVTLSEFPDEIALCVNISNCPGMCEGCSEPGLLEDAGEELTDEKIDKLIEEHPSISVFGLMGGDSDHDDVVRIANYVHEKHHIKVGMYSGRDFLNLDLLNCLDFYKIGKGIYPKGKVEEGHKTNNGPLAFPGSNQLMFEKIDNRGVNITHKFRKEKVGNPENYIIS